MRRVTSAGKVFCALLAAGCILTWRYFHNKHVGAGLDAIPHRLVQQAVPQVVQQAITQRQASEHSPSVGEPSPPSVAEPSPPKVQKLSTPSVAEPSPKVQKPSSPSVASSNGQRLSWWREIVCKQEKNSSHEKGKMLSLKQLLTDVVPDENRNVFLMETACNPTPKFRVWCSVESWARQNPERQVWFLLTAGRTEGNAELISKLFHQYTNLQLVTAELDDMFRDTPLFAFFDKREWTKSWYVENMADMLRVLVLWRWGGVYTDTDTICLRSFNVSDNSVAFESHQLLANGFLSFQAHHPVLYHLMKDMQSLFKPNQWGSIGPQAITRIMKETCGAKMAKRIKGEPVTCPGNITLLRESTFYPVHYSNFEQYFLPGIGNKFNETFNKSFGLHFWNKLSKTWQVKVNSSSVYEVAAKRFCPNTYKFATAESDIF